MKSDPFNVRLRAARDLAGLTQLGARAVCHEIKRRTWEDWEAGRRTPSKMAQCVVLHLLGIFKPRKIRRVK